VLINITGGEDMSIIDINEAANLVMQAADSEANIIFGAGIDEKLEDEVRITVIATGFEKTPFPKKDDLKKKAASERDWTRSFGSAAAGASYGSTPMVQQDYPTPSYEDMSFNMPMDEENSSFGGYNMGGSAIPTPAAVPQMMQQQSFGAAYNQSFQAPQYAQMDYGQQYQAAQPVAQQQPAMQQMEFGQQYQAAQPVAQQPVEQPGAPVQPVQPEAAPQPSQLERNSLGVPAFLRRPTRK